MKEVTNLNSHDAYTALGYAAGKFKVHVESSQVHTRLATFQKKCSQFGKGQKLAVWYIRCRDEQEKQKYLLLAVGETLHNAVLTNPEDVQFAEISETELAGQTFKLHKQDSFAEYEPVSKE